MKSKGFVALLLIIMMSFFITACHEKIEPDYIKNPIYSNLTDMQRSLLRDIAASGIQVVKEGMRFTFIIPTDCFFVKDTRELKTHRERILDELAQFIHDYSNYFNYPRVRISGYTDKTWLSPARDLLSLHYAQTIAEYLREDGVNAKTIRVRGEGAKNPIASNQYPMGTAFNRRVVIVVE